MTPEQHPTGTATASWEPEKSLPQQINVSTRPSHIHLNRLILARLPLALPPLTSSPDLYTVGLQHFAPVYCAFESVWEDIIGLQPLETSSTIDHKVFSALKHLYIPEILRSDRVRADLSSLLQRPLEVVDDELERSDGPKLFEFLEHLGQICAVKPHVLIAYAWVMYMALFNGGRWIRAQLIAARESSWDMPDFSRLSGGTDNGASLGLEFWHFSGEQDGDDIKHEFKARLTDIESLLSVEQRQDIVEEAIEIFRRCALLVEELDDVVASKSILLPAHVDPVPWLTLLLKHIVLLGMAELLYLLKRWVAKSQWYASIMIHWMSRGSGYRDRKTK